VISERENDFFNVHIKTLQQGAQLIVEGTAFEGEPLLLTCKLSMDHRYILFDTGPNPFISYEPIELCKIRSIDMLSVYNHSPTGVKLPSGVDISYKDTEEQVQSLQLSLMKEQSCTEQIRKHSIAWLSAILKAKKLMSTLE